MYDAFIYVGGVMIDLNTLLDSSGTGWALEGAQGINDNGQIVSYGIGGGLGLGRGGERT